MRDLSCALFRATANPLHERSYIISNNASDGRSVLIHNFLHGSFGHCAERSAHNYEQRRVEQSDQRRLRISVHADSSVERLGERWTTAGRATYDPLRYRRRNDHGNGLARGFGRQRRGNGYGDGHPVGSGNTGC